MFRAIKSTDKEDVLKISSQIWDGDDYIAGIFDQWVKADDGIFIGYWNNEKLVGFGRMRYLTSTDIWLEALRKDPQTKIKGIGNKIAQYYVKQLKGKKIQSVRFSTYFDNITSIKLNENLGFEKILTLSLKELNILDYYNKPVDKNIKNKVEFDLLHQFIINSDYLKRTKNFISKGWVAHQYTKELLEEFYSAKNYAAYIEDGVIKGLILFCDAGYKDIFWISFLEARNDRIYKQLLNFATNRTLKKECNRVQLLVPEFDNLKDFVDLSGFESWEQENDFLLYEMPEHLIKQITGTLDDS